VERPRGDRPRRGRDGAEGEGEPAAKSAHRRGERKQGNNTMLFAGAGIGLLAIIVVVLIMMNSGDGKKKAAEAAKVDPAAAAEKPAQPVEPPPQKLEPKAAAGKNEPAKSEPAKGTNAAGEPKPAAAAAGDANPAPAVQPPAAANAPPTEEPGRTKKRWEKLANAPQTMDQVTDPKTYGAVQWAADIDDAKKTEIRALVADASDVNSGIAGIRAKPKLAKQPYEAMFGIVERLSQLDYKSSADSMVAFELNKLLEELTGGLTASFEPVDATEEIVPAKAEWNTRSVKGWLSLLAKFTDAEAFRKDKAARLAKQAEKDK
jgi:hypothetical protein